jgi:hypothetical protein
MLSATDDARLLSLGLHSFHLSLLGLRKLRGDDDQTEIDHEKRTDLRQQNSYEFVHCDNGWSLFIERI